MPNAGSGVGVKPLTARGMMGLEGCGCVSAVVDELGVRCCVTLGCLLGGGPAARVVGDIEC